MELVYRYDPYQPLSIEHPVDFESALATLLDGNGRTVRFVRGLQAATLGENNERTIVPINLVSMGLPVVPGMPVEQRPFALVLGCADARLPIERIFDRSFNDLFVIRVAGNVLGTECLGSSDYAVRQFKASLRIVVVLGHSVCGAVGAAVDSYLNPLGYAEISYTHALRSLVDRVMIAVRVAARAFEDQVGVEVRQEPNYRAALVEATAYLNAAITSFDLLHETPLMREQGIQPMYGVCDTSTLLVTSAPLADDEEGQSSLGLAPSNADEFRALADRIVGKIVAAGRLR